MRVLQPNHTPRQRTNTSIARPRSQPAHLGPQHPQRQHKPSDHRDHRPHQRSDTVSTSANAFATTRIDSHHPSVVQAVRDDLPNPTRASTEHQRRPGSTLEYRGQDLVPNADRTGKSCTAHAASRTELAIRHSIWSQQPSRPGQCQPFSTSGKPAEHRHARSRDSWGFRGQTKKNTASEKYPLHALDGTCNRVAVR